MNTSYQNCLMNYLIEILLQIIHTHFLQFTQHQMCFAFLFSFDCKLAFSFLIHICGKASTSFIYNFIFCPCLKTVAIYAALMNNKMFAIIEANQSCPII